MFTNLEMTTLSQFGMERQSQVEARRRAASLFNETHGRALRQSVWAKLTGRKHELRSLSHYAVAMPAHPSVGTLSVALDRIVGSEGRSEDFDADFNPLKQHSRDRWIGILLARQSGNALPPVELIQVGNEYFVRDGHHRISVAKAIGQLAIDARIVN